MAKKILRIIITEEPQPKGRVRTTFINGKVRSYTPERTQNAQDAIIWRLMRHQEDCFARDIPVKLTATFFRTKSKYLPKRETLPHRKPDLDNLLKLLLDAMIGVLVVDDCQITALRVSKRWTDKEYGYITIKLEEDKP